MLEIEKGAKELNIPVYKANRKIVATTNGGLKYPSPLVFNSEWKHEEPHDDAKRFNYPSVFGVTRPENDEDIAFMTILELGHLIQTEKITSEELVGIFLKRLKRYNPVLEAVITITEDLAYKQAKQADQLLAQGVYLGAVLIGKLVTGSLAYDDIWFGGRTRNPWNIEEFTTGSSAGPAACTSAGMVPFAIGSETAGSITYPAARCGVTALRPTFGAVGRTGVLSLSESLDKLGPLCRSAVDCAIVLDVIRGKDPDDLSSRKILLDDPFSVDITKLTVVDVLKSQGVKMVPFKLGYTVDSAQGILNFTMDVDMLAHFDTWQRSGEDDEESFTVDAFVGNATDWEKVCVSNLVGMPVMVVPVGFEMIPDPPTEKTRRRSTALALTMAYQTITNHHKRRPPIDDLGLDDKIPNPPKAVIPPRKLGG
ncbi:Amidase [Cynara cardunculus var. scolymus]|uniref:Amidase n=1 Tax=Cynara cardunculus var. scolymus TaxID=59895 RepID=A0A103XY36_CYNCS|nr:Amidase [Cynara cardunculus var. scolymus]